MALPTNTFPDAWKNVKICPVFKAGKVNVIGNYRPIAILSNFAKAFELCIFTKLFPQIQNELSPNQHDFFPKRSTVTNLITFMEYTYKAIEEHQQADAIFMDFSKAFCFINWKMLVFTEELVAFFSSYLSCRSQYVEYNGHRSFRFTPTSGAPQGSNLAPLFSIYINDIFNVIDCPSLLFADDLKLFSVVTCDRLRRLHTSSEFIKLHLCLDCSQPSTTQHTEM